MADTNLHGCKCRNCGFELISQSKCTDTFCRFCGAPALSAQNYDSAVSPSLVIESEVDKARARHIFNAHLSKRPLAASALKSKVRSGSFSEVYIPVCLNSLEMQTDISSSLGNAQVISRAKDICSCASSLISPELMSLIGPYDFSKAKAYSDISCDIAYESFSDIQPLIRQATEELEIQAIEKAKEAFSGSEPVRLNSCTHTLTESSSEYALVPLWILNHTKNGLTQQLFINGQSGKIIGELPPSFPRAAMIFGAVAAGCIALGELIWMAVK